MARAYVYDMVDTWNAGATTFTAIKMNVTDTASAAASLLMDLQVGGASKFSISKAGSVLAPIGSAAAPTFAFGVSNTGWYSSISGSIVDLSIGGTQNLRFSSNGMFFTTAAGTVQVSSGGSFSFSSGTAGAASADTILARDAANTLAQRNGTNAQTFRLYNTYTDASNYERAVAGWSGNIFYFGTQAAGTGTGSREIFFFTNGTNRWSIAGSAGHFLAAADNTYDIGVSGANRPRALYLSSGVYAPYLNITSGAGAVRAFWYSGADNVMALGNSTGAGGSLELTEDTAPAAPATNSVRIYAEDNGAGKTRIMARFATGAAVQIAIEP